MLVHNQHRLEWVRTYWFENGYVRTPLGGFINHSEHPNCYIDTSKGDRTLHTVIPVRKGEELTVYYRFKGYDGTVGDDTHVEIHN